MHRRDMAKASLAAVATASMAATNRAAAADDAVSLASWGNFHVGGRLVEISGKPMREVVFSPGGVPAKLDPNGTYMTGGMYAQYMIPSRQRGSAPLLLWHGGGLTGVCWETTPDGREGFQHYFLRRGWAVYVSDAVERGRSGFSPPEIMGGEPLFLTVSNPYERFRIGDGPGSFARGSVLPGCTFPADRASYLQFTKQNVPRWTTTDDATVAAYIAYLEKVGPSVVMVHSQGGLFGWTVAQARPHLFKALILLEPAAMPAPKPEALRDIPQLVVYGDNIASDSRWPTIRANGIKFADGIRAAGGSVDVVDLPERGIKGNSHMMMMDHNNEAVAGVVQDWLVSKRLWS